MIHVPVQYMRNALLTCERIGYALVEAHVASAL